MLSVLELIQWAEQSQERAIRVTMMKAADALMAK